jgi:hypothetical protein
MTPPISCERCQISISDAVEIPPMHGTRGAHLYRCQACDHVTWRWIDPGTSAPSQAPDTAEN